MLRLPCPVLRVPILLRGRTRQSGPVTFTDRFVSGIRADANRRHLFDTHRDGRGLALRVSPKGTKSWAFVYRVQGDPPQSSRSALTPPSRSPMRGRRRSTSGTRSTSKARTPRPSGAARAPRARTRRRRVHVRGLRAGVLAFQKGR